MSYSIIIPARFESTRLPGKPLAEIAGKPMIQHVYERASASRAEEVIVATDHEQVYNAVLDFGGETIMTSSEHPSGTDRLQEVANRRGYADDHVIVNVQGDEPLIPVAAIEQVADNIANFSDAGIATLCEKILAPEDLLDPNAVKVVRDEQQMALYFSRAMIPFARAHQASIVKSIPLEASILDEFEHSWFRHIGIYAYRVNVLHQFVHWPVAPLENIEMLEQLRAMYNGIRIHCAEASEPVPAGVDTPEDLQRIRNILQA